MSTTFSSRRRLLSAAAIAAGSASPLVAAAAAKKKKKKKPQTDKNGNTFYGTTAGKGMVPGTAFNTAMGADALSGGVNGNGNVAVGAQALKSVISGSANTAVGRQAMENLTNGVSNIGIGEGALGAFGTGSRNTVVGVGALSASFNSDNNTAVGYLAMSGADPGPWINSSALGAQAEVTGSDQVQLGNSSTTTYCYGTVQNRSDRRDKADIQDTTLGLAFIQALRPVDFRWDLRDDYRVARPASPESTADAATLAAFESELATWRATSKMSALVHDGSKKRTRFHHGLIAQEVGELIATTGVEFGGFQDHTLAGGADVLSLGYDEFIAPLIKAVQELATMNASLSTTIAAQEARLDALSQQLTALATERDLATAPAGELA